MQNTHHGAQIPGHAVFRLAGCLASSSPTERQQDSVKGGETMCGHTHTLQPDCPAPGGQPFVTNTCQSSLTWHHHSLSDSVGPLYSRSCQTLLGNSSPFLPPVSMSQPSSTVLVQSPLLSKKQAAKLAALCCRETESWPAEQLLGSRVM